MTDAAELQAPARRRDGDSGLCNTASATGSILDLDLKTIHHCVQPLILVTNPGSGRKGLYAASVNTMWIEGMDRDESETILQQCFDIAEDHGDHLRSRMARRRSHHVGQLGLPACAHRLAAEQTRTLRRCTVEGEPLY